MVPSLSLMKQPEWVIKACERAIRLARYETAALSIPQDDIDELLKREAKFGRAERDATDIIRKNTMVYVESWMIPLLKAIRDGDRHTIERYLL